MTQDKERQLYQQLQQKLQQVQADLVAETTTLDQLKTATQLLQQQLKEAIDHYTATDNMQVQAIHTEINKQFRLLGSDLLFWQAARQAETKQQRQQQIQARLKLLYQYCEMLLMQLEAKEP